MEPSVTHSRFGRALPVALAIVLVSLVACAEMPSGPVPISGAKAMRDSTAVPEGEGDSTACRSGFIIVTGRVVCNSEG